MSTEWEYCIAQRGLQFCVSSFTTAGEASTGFIARAVEIPCLAYPTCFISLRTSKKFQFTCPGSRDIYVFFISGRKYMLWVLIRSASLKYF